MIKFAVLRKIEIINSSKETLFQQLSSDDSIKKFAGAGIGLKIPADLLPWLESYKVSLKKAYTHY